MRTVAGQFEDAGSVAQQPGGGGGEEGALLRSSSSVREEESEKKGLSFSCALLQLLEASGLGEVFAVLLASYLHSSDIRALLIASPSVARSAAIREALFFSLCLRQQRARDYSTTASPPHPPPTSPLPLLFPQPSLPPSASHLQDAVPPPLPPQPPALLPPPLLPPPSSARSLNSMPFPYSPNIQKKETDDEHDNTSSSSSQLFAAVVSGEGRVSVQRSGLRVKSCMEFYFQYLHHTHCHECSRKLYEAEDDEAEAEHMAAFTSARKRDKRTAAATTTTVAAANKGDSSPPLCLCAHCRLLLCANSADVQATVAELISHRTLFGQLLGKMTVSLPPPKQWTETSLRVFLGVSHGGLLLYMQNWKLVEDLHRRNSRLLLQRWRKDFLSSSGETYGLSFSRLCLEPLFEIASKYASRASAATGLSQEANRSRRTDPEGETGELHSAALVPCDDGEEEMRGGQPETLRSASNADDIDLREEEQEEVSARRLNQQRRTGGPTSADEGQAERHTEAFIKEKARQCRHSSSSRGQSLSRRRRQDHARHEEVLEEVRDLLLLLGRVGTSGIAAAREADSETVSLLQQTHHRESDYYHMLVASVYVAFRTPFLLFQYTSSLTVFGRQTKLLREALDAFFTLYCHPDLKGLSEIVRQWLACRFPSTSPAGGLCGGTASKESTSPSLVFPSYDSIPLTEAFDEQALVQNYVFGVTLLFFQQRDGGTLQPGRSRPALAADERPPGERRRRREEEREGGKEEEEGLLCLRYQRRLRLFPFGRKERKLIVETLLLPFLFARKPPFQQTAPNREAEGMCAKREEEEEEEDGANHKHQDRRKPDSSPSPCTQPCPSSSHLLFKTPKRSLASVDPDHHNHHAFPLPKALCTS